MVKRDGNLSATAYVLTQKHLQDDFEAPAFQFGPFRTYQVPVARVEGSTGLSFGNLSHFDPFADAEAAAAVRALESVEDVVL